MTEDAIEETGEALERGDEPSPTRSAVLVRLSHSHVRFGTFQRTAYLERPDLTAALVEHARAHYHPSVAEGDVPGLMAAIVAASARLTARWYFAQQPVRRREIIWPLRLTIVRSSLTSLKST